MINDDFRARLGPGPFSVARGPGRVNLIGEHTDYNGGYVLPAAIDRDVRIAFRPTDDARVELFSLDFNEAAVFPLDKLDRDSVPAWARYPMGVAWALQREGFRLRGLRGVVKGTVPQGAGLSSSAAFEAAASLAFCHAAGVTAPRQRLARICQMAENDFVGMNCGIMDQFASLLGRLGCALFIDCETLSHETVSLHDALARIVVADTRVERRLVDSAYNRRRQECEEAFVTLKRRHPTARSYHDIAVPMFKRVEEALPPPLRQRARHVVTENARVLDAVRRLKTGDLVGFGALMDASHESLRDDFEVSCRELDVMVALAREVHGVYGSRMTGAGFGGCTVSLVRPDRVEEFVRVVAAGYRAETGIEPGMHVFQAADGAGIEEVT